MFDGAYVKSKLFNARDYFWRRRKRLTSVWWASAPPASYPHLRRVGSSSYFLTNKKSSEKKKIVYKYRYRFRFRFSRKGFSGTVSAPAIISNGFPVPIPGADGEDDLYRPCVIIIITVIYVLRGTPPFVSAARSMAFGFPGAGPARRRITGRTSPHSRPTNGDLSERFPGRTGPGNRTAAPADA